MTRTINNLALRIFLQKDKILLTFPVRVKQDFTQHADVSDVNFHVILFI